MFGFKQKKPNAAHSGQSGVSQFLQKGYVLKKQVISKQKVLYNSLRYKLWHDKLLNTKNTQPSNNIGYRLLYSRDINQRIDENVRDN